MPIGKPTLDAHATINAESTPTISSAAWSPSCLVSGGVRSTSAVTSAADSSRIRRCGCAKKRFIKLSINRIRGSCGPHVWRRIDVHPLCTGRDHRRAHQCRRRRRPRSQQPMLTIRDRPFPVIDRSQAGHWDRDLIIGNNHGTAIGTLGSNARAGCCDWCICQAVTPTPCTPRR